MAFYGSRAQSNRPLRVLHLVCGRFGFVGRGSGMVVNPAACQIISLTLSRSGPRMRTLRNDQWFAKYTPASESRKDLLTSRLLRQTFSALDHDDTTSHSKIRKYAERHIIGPSRAVPYCSQYPAMEVTSFFSTAYNPSGNHYLSTCGAQNSNVLRYPQVFVDPTSTTRSWLTGSYDGQFLQVDEENQVRRLDFRENETISYNESLPGSFVATRPLSAQYAPEVLEAALLESNGTMETPMIFPPLMPLGSPPDSSEFSAPVPLPDGGYLYIASVAGGSFSDAILVQVNAQGEDVTPSELREQIDRPLIDGAIVYSYTNQLWAIYHGSTIERNVHGALGDKYEGYKLSLLQWDGDSQQILPKDTIVLGGSTLVYEGLGPMWADINGDGVDDLLTTVSDTGEGAQLRAYIFEAGPEQAFQVAFEAQSSFIGRGNRWLHQLGVGPLGPNGEIEIVQVKQPHLTGQVRYHRLEKDTQRLVEVERVDDRALTTHGLGSRNLDQVTIGDFNNDGIPEVVLTSFLSDQLIGLQRTDSGIEEAWSVSLDSALISNIAVSCASPISETDTSTEHPQILLATRGELVRLRFEYIGEDEGLPTEFSEGNYFVAWLPVFLSILAIVAL